MQGIARTPILPFRRILFSGEIQTYREPVVAEAHYDTTSALQTNSLLAAVASLSHDTTNHVTLLTRSSTSVVSSAQRYST